MVFPKKRIQRVDAQVVFSLLVATPEGHLNSESSQTGKGLNPIIFWEKRRSMVSKKTSLL
jgi:hypothetical protein